MRLLVFLIIALAFTTGCNKQKEVLCTYPVYMIPPYLGFSGYTAAELDTVYVNSYSDVSFTQLQKRDTILSSGAQLLAGSPHIPLQSGSAYQVTLPIPNRQHRISKIIYNSAPSIQVSSSKGCLGRTFNHPADSAVVDGMVYPASVLSTNNNYVVLYK